MVTVVMDRGSGECMSFAFTTARRLDRLVSDADAADDQLVDRLRVMEALTTQLMLAQAGDLVELRRRRLAEQAARGAKGPEVDDDGWLVHELALALRLSERQVHDRLDRALALQRYNSVQFAASAGGLQAWTAQRLVRHLDELGQYVSPERLVEIERQTVEWLLDEPRSVTALNARMRRLLLKAKAAAGETSDDDVARREQGRRVSLSCEGDGMASLWARLPEADGLAVAQALDARARRPVDDSDERTVAQRQADQLVALLTGAPSLRGHPDDVPTDNRPGTTGTAAPAGVTVQLSVTVPVQTLVGGDEPAEVPGFGSIPAATARRLAGTDGAQARPLIYDGTNGRLLGLGQYLPATGWWADGSATVAWRADIGPASGYEHPPLMDEFIRARDRWCRAPGCRRRAERCDCDHIVPYPEGATSIENGHCLCRRHHRLKTHARSWTVASSTASEPGDDSVTWRSPTGISVTTTPHDYRAEEDVPPF